MMIIKSICEQNYVELAQNYSYRMGKGIVLVNYDKITIE